MRLLVLSNIVPPIASAVTYYYPATIGISKKQQFLVTITITGTSSGLQHSTTVPLTLQ
jgi:hypothetical protein